MEFKRYKLGDCLLLIRNGAVIQQRKGATGLPITRIETLSNNRFNRDRLGYADITDAKLYSSYILEDCDLLMSHINSKEFLGRTILYKQKNNECIIHGMNLLRIKTNPLILDSYYAYYLFQTSYFRKIINSIRKDAINQSSISISDICNLKFDLPSIENQRKIITILKDLDYKITINRQINDNLEAMAKQLYDYWFVQFDFPNDEGKPYKSSGGKMIWNEKLKREIPEKWEILPIYSILDKVKSTPRLTTDEYMTIGQYPIIDQTVNIYHAGFTDRKDAVVRQFPAVIFGDHSCVVKYVNFPFVRGADGTQVMLSKDERISVEYLYFATKIIPLREGYARHFSLLKESFIIIPCISIAKEYKEIASNLFRMITYNRKNIITLSKQRDELLPLLMNGQVSVNYHLSDD